MRSRLPPLPALLCHACDCSLASPSRLGSNNFYLGTLFQLDKDADTREVLLGKGDVTLNDDPQLGTLRSTLAEVIAQTLECGAGENADFTCVNAKGEFPEPALLRERLAAL